MDQVQHPEAESPDAANTADVIVVGGGGAGLAAAAEAARLGRRVIVVEKNPRLGGSTAMAVGSLMAAGTKMQRKAGIEDSPRRHAQELAQAVERLGVSDNVELRRLLTENAADTLAFLISIGVDFIGPLAQPPFATNRFYQALPGGYAYIYRLGRYCRKLGVDIRLSSAARQLLTTNERVTGVEVETADGQHIRLSARAAVILASGDFAANREMRSEVFGPGIEMVDPINPTATGDGQRMAIEIGARLALRPDVRAAGLVRCRFPPPRRNFFNTLPPYRPITLMMKLAMQFLPVKLLRPMILRAALTSMAPERALFEQGAILVNRNGERFADECATFAVEIAKQEGGEAFVVFDRRIARLFSAWPYFVSTAPGLAFAYVDDYRRARKDIFFEAPSIEALAAHLGVSGDHLKQTMSAHRATGEASSPPAAPFYALGPLKPCIVVTPVGLAVDSRLQVLGESGRPISGLFAAGGSGQGGFTVVGHGHGIGWALTSGRLAGRHAASEI